MCNVIFWQFWGIQQGVIFGLVLLPNYFHKNNRFLFLPVCQEILNRKKEEFWANFKPDSSPSYTLRNIQVCVRWTLRWWAGWSCLSQRYNICGILWPPTWSINNWFMIRGCKSKVWSKEWGSVGIGSPVSAPTGCISAGTVYKSVDGLCCGCFS